MQSKKYNVPPLDFTNIKVKKRRNSDSEINTHKTLKRKNIDSVIQKHKETCMFIKEIHEKLEKIQNINSLYKNDSEIDEAMKEIRNRVSEVEKNYSPKLISRCDAMIGNTQMIITNTKQNLDYLKIVDEDFEQHDILTVTILSDIVKDIIEIKAILQKIVVKLNI